VSSKETTFMISLAVSSIIIFVSSAATLFLLFGIPDPDNPNTSISLLGLGAIFCIVFSWPLACYELKIPYTWPLITAIVYLLEVVPPGIHLLIGLLGSFAVFPLIFTLLAPFIGLMFKKGREEARWQAKVRDEEIKRLEKEVLVLARKYGGILTVSTVVAEKEVTLEEAMTVLERFCMYGEAIKKKTGFLTIYDFPGIRLHLSDVENKIIEVLRDNPQGMSFGELLQATKLPVESLKESLKELESLKIVEESADRYRLRGIHPPTRVFE